MEQYGSFNLASNWQLHNSNEFIEKNVFCQNESFKKNQIYWNGRNNKKKYFWTRSSNLISSNSLMLNLFETKKEKWLTAKPRATKKNKKQKHNLTLQIVQCFYRITVRATILHFLTRKESKEYFIPFFFESFSFCFFLEFQLFWMWIVIKS